jgi:hypothetical protein
MKYEDIQKYWLDFVKDPDYRKYFSSNKDLWLINLNDTITYIKKYKKRPPYYDKDKTIAKLGRWLASQIMNYRDKKYIMSDNNMRKKFKEFLDNDKYSLFVSEKDKWYNNLNEIKKYINIHNKKPRLGPKNIKILGNWIQTQKKNYKNKIGIMKEKTIFTEWHNFINDDKYKKYFK